MLDILWESTRVLLYIISSSCIDKLLINFPLLTFETTKICFLHQGLSYGGFCISNTIIFYIAEGEKNNKRKKGNIYLIQSILYRYI